MNKKLARMRRATKLRSKLRKLGAVSLLVHRTARHVYAQIISLATSEILVSASTVEKLLVKDLKNTGNKDAAVIIGKVIAERALKKGIQKISFDRSGFKYHGRVKALAESARKSGLQF